MKWLVVSRRPGDDGYETRIVEEDDARAAASATNADGHVYVAPLEHVTIFAAELVTITTVRLRATEPPK